jgi:predicted transposase YbfD/YdcC
VFSDGIRGHWRIENSLHYVKDVTMKEDTSRTRTKNAPQNISLMKNLALNLLRQAGYTNIAQAIRLVANDIPKIWEMVSA